MKNSSSKVISILTTVHIGANAIVFLGFGLMFIFWTDKWAAMLQTQLTSATAYADYRAVYGGIPFGVGLLFVAGFFSREYVKASLLTIAGTSGFLALSRLYSFTVTDGPVENFIYYFLASEVLSAALAIWLFLAHSRVS